MTPRTLVAGIDEAGYGPLVGPLVVAASAYALEDGARESELHKLVDDERARDEGLPTADSKRLFHGGGSLARIELSTAGHAALARGALPVTVGGLLADAVDFDASELDELPWYRDALLDTPLPRQLSADDVLDRARAHQQRLQQRGASFAGLFLAPVPVPRFNRLSSAAGSKAFTLFRATGALIAALVERYAHETLVIHVDRQGGRIHYGALLQTFFPMAPLTTLKERPAESSYRLQFPGREPVTIRFQVKADGSRAPVAVASIAAKTLRELFMARLNAWFVQQQPGLKPSAGYGTDGQRFVRDVTPLLKSLGIARDLLVRCR